MEIGYFLSSEEFGPKDLLAQASLVESAVLPARRARRGGGVGVRAQGPRL